MSKTQVKMFPGTPDGFNKMNEFLKKNSIEYVDLKWYSPHWVVIYKQNKDSQKYNRKTDFIYNWLPNFSKDLKEAFSEKDLQEIEMLSIQLSNKIKKFQMRRKRH
jgi:hypothetical protein